jgi:hypothetical protein|tara:strand:+ start:214 stop:552 length:339 start_codon:yes stop_codon:yes gene_type:complete
MSWEELVEQSRPTVDEYGKYMSWMFEEMKKVNGGSLSLEEFERIIKEPNFDIEGYIVSKNITQQQEEELVSRIGEDWKKKLWWKYQRFVLVGDWDIEWKKAMDAVHKQFTDK